MISKDKKQITISLPLEFIEALENIADEVKVQTGSTITKSDLIAMALIGMFKAHQKKSEENKTNKKEEC